MPPNDGASFLRRGFACARARIRRYWPALTALSLGLLVSATAYAQRLDDLFGGKDEITNKPLVLMFALAAMALVPFVLIMVTSFVKIAVVLSIVRQAIGTQQIPPTQVITGLAIILTVYIMTPVGYEMYNASKGRFQSANIMQVTVDQMIAAARDSQHPMRKFLEKHAHLKERDMFYKLGYQMRGAGEKPNEDDFGVLVPAFVISELKEAFQIGFILFVPFLVIDMVVSNILMALGMQMLSPTTISLPFKILLFVLVDGWYLITRGLVLGYM